MKDKIESIHKAPSPSNVSELTSFLGLLNYYRIFLPNLSTVLQLYMNCFKMMYGGCGQRTVKKHFRRVRD